MSEAKPIASLSSVLLARKGAARPAMRRQVISNGHGVAVAASHEDLGWNDMGYDVDPDPGAPMDYEHGFGVNPLAAAVPDVTPEVRAQQNRIAEQLNVQAETTDALQHQEPSAPVVPIKPVKVQVNLEPVADAPIAAAPEAAAKAKLPRAVPGLKAKTAFTLRLDGDRHLRLRLACAVGNRSAQQLVTAALDAYIEAMPEIGALAAQLPSKSSNSSH